MNNQIHTSQLLDKYTKITNNIYLRTDSKAIAVIADEDKSNTKLGFLTITPKSRKEFTAIGLILEDKVLETLINTTQNPNKSVFSNPLIGGGLISNISTYIKEYKTNNLLITKDQIQKFESENKISDAKNLANYLHNFAQIPSEDYAADTLKNKLYTTYKTLKLRYSPQMAKERNELRARLKEQMPKLINQIYNLLQKVEDNYVSNATNTSNEEKNNYKKMIYELESFTGEKIGNLTKLTRTELDKLIPKIEKNMKHKIKFTSNPASEYDLTTLIQTYSDSINLTRRTNFQIHSKNNY
jgi:hypothetical protein